MCEILVRVVDKTNPDPYLDVGCTKRGDVIAVVEDGWGWGAEELRNPEWRIVKLPNVPAAMAQNFLAGEVDTDPARPSRMLRKRAIHLDLASFPKAAQTWLADATRAEPARSVTITPAQFGKLKIVKTKVADPNVLD